MNLMPPKRVKNSEPEDEQNKCRLDAKLKVSTINPRHKEPRTTQPYTTWGVVSSGISKIRISRDPNY